MAAMVSKPAALQRAATAPVLAAAEAFRGRISGTSPVRRPLSVPGGGKRATHDREQGRSSPAALLARFTPTPAVLATLAMLSICICVAIPSLLGGYLAAEDAAGPGTDSPGLGRRSSVVPALQNRRMALETSLISQKTTLKAESGAAAAVEIEYREAGHRVPLAAALDASRWSEPVIFDAESEIADVQALDALLAPLHQSDNNAPLPAHCPQGPVRIFIGIMTRCCVASARDKRDAIRSTWLAEALARYPNSISAAFIVSQPGGDAAAVALAADFLSGEVQEHGDIVVLPGTEDYFKLVEKTLGMLRYALSSPCRFTHVLKTDDDVFLRPQRLKEIIEKGEFHFQLKVQAPPTARLFFDGHRRVNDTVPLEFTSSTDAASTDAAQALPVPLLHTLKPVLAPAPPKPWLKGVYLGKVDSNLSGTFPGWHPIRLRTSKWYLPAATLSDGDAPLGVRWASGWGYMMSRDVLEAVWGAAVQQASNVTRRASWWGWLPWEDVVVAALLAEAEIDGEKVMLSHHDGFKAAWDGCDSGTVLKHLDNDAPMLTAGLAAQEASGLWAVKEVVCSSGPFVPGQYGAWREWRNQREDSLLNGFM